MPETSFDPTARILAAETRPRRGDPDDAGRENPSPELLALRQAAPPGRSTSSAQTALRAQRVQRAAVAAVGPCPAPRRDSQHEIDRRRTDGSLYCRGCDADLSSIEPCFGDC